MTHVAFVIAYIFRWIARPSMCKQNGRPFVQVITFQNLQNMKKIHVLQLQPLRHNPWQQLCEFSSKNDIELESSLKDSHFFKGLTILLSP